MASIELTVAYPGREGAHSAAACDRLFPAARLVPLPTFSDVVDAVASGRVPYGVLPIESSLVGPVAETHDLLYESSLSIVAEAIVPVNHCLVGPAVVRLEDVREIHSHPVALDQCRRLLASLPNARAVAAPTTGDAASTVADLADPTVVAIASDRAARINALTIIDGNVGDHPEAYTRFVSVAPYTRLDRREGQWRTAFSFTTDHRPGALHRCARAARPPPHRPQPARVAADSVAAVQLPLRRGPRWPPARPGDRVDAEGDARPDRAAPRLRLLSRRPGGRRRWRAAAEKKEALRRPRTRTARATADTGASSPAPAAPRGG